MRPRRVTVQSFALVGWERAVGGIRRHGGTRKANGRHANGLDQRDPVDDVGEVRNEKGR